MKTESYVYRAPARPSHLLVTADHATNIVPPWVNGGDLEIDEADMNRHIAYDIGTLGLSEMMSENLGAHFLASQFSRLVIDPNRGEDDPTLIMKIYDRTIIPANRSIEQAGRDERLNRLHRPYHEKFAQILSEIRDQGMTPVIFAIHSFTPQLRGRAPRPWHVGVLSTTDRRMADPLIAALQAEGDLVVGDNEPYKGSLKGDSMHRHAINGEFAHGLIEVRNDLIETPEDQRNWAERLTRIVRQVLENEGYANGSTNGN